MSSSLTEELFLKYRGLIYRACTRYKISGFETDDIMQEAYFPFLMALKDYKTDNKGYSFKTFLYNRLNWYFMRLASSVNSKSKALYILDEYIDDEQSTARIETVEDEDARFDDDVIKSVTLDEIMRCINALPKDERLFVTEHYAKGKSFSLVARENGTSYERVRTVSARGLRKLRFDRRISRLYDDLASDSHRMYSGSLKRFKENFTSSTEAVALDRISTKGDGEK